MNPKEELEYTNYVRKKTKSELFQIRDSIDRSRYNRQYEIVNRRLAELNELPDDSPLNQFRVQISSGWTFVYKVMLPFFSILIMGLVLPAFIFSGQIWQLPWFFLPMMLGGLALELYFCLPLRFVEIDKHNLYVSNYFRTVSIERHLIERVTENTWLNIHPVRIHFREETPVGRSIVFMPEVRAFSFLQSHPIVNKILNRDFP